MTERLYYADAHLRAFAAQVLSCREEKGRWAVTLDRTAFFPEGGGQPGDRGGLGGASVLDTRERAGEIVHLCDRPLGEGETVEGVLDWDTRFARMQIHSAEHIVSGTAHRLWGCENVGFHMTQEAAVLDFDRELTAERLRELEERVNRIVWDNRPVRAFFPSAEELSGLHFRQKKALTGAVRLVEIQDADLCACCAPHVRATGEIGLVRLTDAMRHRGGVRLTMTAGRAAWELAYRQGESVAALSALLSAPRDKLLPAAERLCRERDDARLALAAAERRYTSALCDRAPEGETALCCFLPEGVSAAALRELAEGLSKKCGRWAAAFSGGAGAWRCAVASQGEDLHQESRALFAALRGRGGGAAGLLQGSVSASREEILAYFQGKTVE